MAAAPTDSKYQLVAPDFRCQQCAAEVPCEAYYRSAVFCEPLAEGGGGFGRQTFCEGCWAKGVPAAFAYWRSRRPPLPEDKPKRLKLDTVLLLDFFRRLVDDGVSVVPPPHRVNGAGETVKADAGAGNSSAEERHELRFVIALLLVRKKILQFGNTYQQDGAEWLQMLEKSAPPRPHWVKNPELSDDQLERVKVRIGDLLQMQL